jgi:hypothetical protein
LEDSLNARNVQLISVIFAFVTLNIVSAAAQDVQQATSQGEKAQRKVKDATQQGFPLTNVSSTDVTDNISVEATMIPARIAKTVFGKEVSNNYAVIALTISNRSSDYVFVMHTIFIDYSQWLLGGNSPYSLNALCTESQKQKARASTSTGPSPSTSASGTSSTSQQSSTAGTSSTGQAATPQPQSDSSIVQTSDCQGNPLQKWQQQTRSNQINSVETRIVRGELLARQPWTTRNWVLRALQNIGSIATSFTFATSSQSWIRGIGAFTGAGVPAAQNFWPDATIGQMNEISDVGFQVNKAIPTQSSNIVVAFFPIERFLTPSLKALFIEDPAAYFSPIEALMDPQSKDKVKLYLFRLFPNEGEANKALGNLFHYLHQISSGACNNLSPQPSKSTQALSGNGLEDACITADVVNRLSLNTVRILVGGTTTVDVNNVPPQISTVEIDAPAGKNLGDMWSQQGAVLTGIIHGSFLSGATPSLVNPDQGVTIKKVDEGSTDTQLNFTLNLASGLPQTTTQLQFQVSKPSSSGSTMKSAAYSYQVERAAPTTSPQSGPGNSTAPHSGATPASSDKTPSKK